MSLYLLDTDWIVDVLHGQESATQTLLELAPSGLALSIITYGELYEGAYYSRQPEPALAGLHAFLEGKEILPLTIAIMERFAVVRSALSRSIRRQVGEWISLSPPLLLKMTLPYSPAISKTFSTFPASSSFNSASWAFLHQPQDFAKFYK